MAYAKGGKDEEVQSISICILFGNWTLGSITTRSSTDEPYSELAGESKEIILK